MKKEARILLAQSVDSLVLCVEHFNRPWDRGRVASVLIQLDHGLELLLKAGIVHRGGRIRRPQENQTIGFAECVRKALSDGEIKFLTDEQALLLQTVNLLRDAAYHYYLTIREEHLYIQVRAAVTLFSDILNDVFQKDLSQDLPDRVLPISTLPPVALDVVFSNEVDLVRNLLRPGLRRRTEAIGRLRALSITDRALLGQRIQPTEAELARLGNDVSSGKSVEELFPGVAAIQLTSTGSGPSLDLRFTKKEGIPIHTVPADTPGAAVVGIKRVNELDFYNLSHTQLANRLGISGNMLSAIVWKGALKQDEDCYKMFPNDKPLFGRYSQKAIERAKAIISNQSSSEVWAEYRANLARLRHGPSGRG